MEEPKATSKHTLCGYAWTDVTSSLQRTIGTTDMPRALRWSSELVCSDLGLGRLEAILFHAWAQHVGGALPGWCRTWFVTIQHLRSFWKKSNGDIKSVRNTPIVRQLVAEAVATLVLAQKKPLPALPTANDCFREAEAMRTRIRSGGGAGDQYCTRRIWVAGIDGEDLKTIGNELEAALRTNQTQRLMFWIVWILTLDTQPDPPRAKDRGPAHLSLKQRTSIVWFLVSLLKELANECAFLSVEERNGVFQTLELTWPKLGSRGRRDVLASIGIAIMEEFAKKGSLRLTTQTTVPSHDAIRNATRSIDTIYSEIAEEARRYVLEKPVMTGLTREAAKAIKAEKPKTVLSPVDKLQLSYSLQRF